MKKKTEKRDLSDGLRRGYDFSQLKEGVRGKYAARYDEEEETLAAIDQGIRDAKAGRKELASSVGAFGAIGRLRRGRKTLRHLAQAFAQGLANAFEYVGAGFTKLFFCCSGNS
jgi:hypothetical protein